MGFHIRLKRELNIIGFFAGKGKVYTALDRRLSRILGYFRRSRVVAKGLSWLAASGHKHLGLMAVLASLAAELRY